MTQVAAIVILYHPDIAVLRRNLRNVHKQVDHLILVDNTPKGFELDTDFEGCEYIPNHANLGIALAQNIGIRYALDLGADYVVLFDQDSTIQEDLINSLTEAFRLQGRPEKLACVGPRVLDEFSSQIVRPRVQREIATVGRLTLCSQIIASGQMISREALENVGLMEAELFIDGVDHEWCWRARSLGFGVAIDENTIMQHRLGDGRETFLGISYKITSPVRLYYQFRNILNLSRRNYVPLYWKVRNLIAIPLRFFLMSLQPRRKEYIKFMAKGIFDGIRGKYGAVEDSR